MKTLVLVGRSIGAAGAGGVSALAGFGLLLAITWRPTFSANTAYKATTTLLAAAVGFFIGGYVAGLLAGRRRALHGGIFGLALGLFAFAYVLGPGWYVLIASVLAGLLGARRMVSPAMNLGVESVARLARISARHFGANVASLDWRNRTFRL